MTSCPNCGFDLADDGHCPVCGYASESRRRPETEEAATHRRDGTVGRPRGVESAAAAGPTRRTSGDRGGRRVNVPLVVAAAVVLIALVGVGVGVLRTGAPSPGGQAVQGRSGAALAARAPTPAKSTSTNPHGSRAGTPAGAANAGFSTTPAARPTGKTGRIGTADAGSGPTSRVGFSAPVGASPVSIRATHPVDLYTPSTQPVFNITGRTGLPPLTSEHAYVKWMLDHTHQKEKFLRERWIRAMKAYDRHLVVHRRVLMAFLLTPREWFVRPYNLKNTYENSALPIGYGQTISGPDLVAHMTDALDPQPNQRVLEIGTGSGYQSALLSQLSNFVYTIEIVRPLAEQTNEIYLEHTAAMPEYANIHRRLADGYYGWPAYAPFDRIIVTTGIDHIPPDLLKELKPGGIMVIPIGPPTGQTILKITKTVDKAGRVHLKRQDLYPGITDIFVPFTASGGGTHDTVGGTAKR